MAVCLKEKNNVYFCPIIMDSKQFTNILYKFISHKPWALVIAIIAITILFLLGALKLEFDPSLKSMVPKQHEFLKTPASGKTFARRPIASSERGDASPSALRDSGSSCFVLRGHGTSSSRSSGIASEWMGVLEGPGT